jgi:hypothetical protein
VSAKPSSGKRKQLLLITDSSSSSKSKLLINAPDAQSYQEWVAVLNEVIDILSGKHKAAPEAIIHLKTANVEQFPISTVKESSGTSSDVISGSRGYVMKSKVASGKVFVNVFYDESVDLSAVILGNNCPHPVPDKEGVLSDTYDVCINIDSKSDDFNREVSCMLQLLMVC